MVRPARNWETVGAYIVAGASLSALLIFAAEVRGSLMSCGSCIFRKAGLWRSTDYSYAFGLAVQVEDEGFRTALKHRKWLLGLCMVPAVGP